MVKTPKLTKEQEKAANFLQDAGVPGDIAVFLVIRSDNCTDYDSCLPMDYVAACNLWAEQPEGHQWWWDFDDAFQAEMRAMGNP